MLAATVAALGLVLAAAADARADWTMYRGDAGRTGYVQTSLNAANFAQAWSVPITFQSSGTGSWYEQGVTIDGTRAFITALEGYAPAGNYHVMALNLADGTEAWRRTIQGRAFDGVSSPSYMNGTVYVNRAGHSGISGGTDADLPKLIAINSVTGAIKWETPYSAQWGENFRPIPTGSQVFAAGGYYGGFYGYNGTTGAQQWFNPNSTWDPANANVAVDDLYVYVHGNRYHRSSGAPAGPIMHPAGASLFNPVVHGDERFFATQISSGASGFAAFDAVTLQRLWEHPTPSYVRNAAVSDQHIALLVGNNLTLLDRQTGTPTGITWNGPSSLWSDLVLTDSHVFLSSNAQVYAVSLATGQSVWTGPVGGELGLSDGMLLVSNRNHLTAFHVPEPASGAMVLLLLGATACTRRCHRRG